MRREAENTPASSICSDSSTGSADSSTLSCGSTASGSSASRCSRPITCRKYASSLCGSRFVTSRSSSIFLASAIDSISSASPSSSASTSCSNISSRVMTFSTDSVNPDITALYIFFLTSRGIFDAAPAINSFSFFSLANCRILLALIPATPSASGSRSPADTMAMVFILYSLSLYLFNNTSNSFTRSEPTIIVTSVNFSLSRDCIISMTVLAFDLITTLPNAARANDILSEYDRGSLLLF